jgi:long-subunit fatty acid transport protein
MEVMPKWHYRLVFMLLIQCFPLCASGQVANVLTSVGAVNRGAATAMPLDASNSQYWNPASITDLPATELDLSAQSSFPQTTVEAALPLRAVNPSAPDTMLSGEVKNENRTNTGFSIGFVKKRDQSHWTFGVLSSALLSAGVHYPESAHNPLTSPSVGAGSIKVSGDLYYVAPTVAYRLNRYWSMGVQPSVIVTSLKASPFSRANPDDANNDGIATYPSSNRAWATGLGVQGGVYFHRNAVHLGASLKSPQWFTPFHFKGTDELGNTRHFSDTFKTPMIFSMGVGYSGIPRVKLSMDARYVDYENSSLGQQGYTRPGGIKGPGWRNIWAFVQSTQVQMTKKCILRMAYSYNQSPIQPEFTSFSLASPALVKHQLSVALSYRLRPHTAIAVSYQHGFASSSEGQIQRPRGAIPGSSVKLTSSLDSITASLVFLFK